MELCVGQVIAPFGVLVSLPIAALDLDVEHVVQEPAPIDLSDPLAEVREALHLTRDSGVTCNCTRICTPC